MYNIEDIYSFVSGKISIAISESTDLQNAANYKVIDIRKKLPKNLNITFEKYGIINVLRSLRLKYELDLSNFPTQPNYNFI